MRDPTDYSPPKASAEAKRSFCANENIQRRSPQAWGFAIIRWYQKRNRQIHIRVLRDPSDKSPRTKNGDRPTHLWLLTTYPAHLIINWKNDRYLYKPEQSAMSIWDWRCIGPCRDRMVKEGQFNSRPGYLFVTVFFCFLMQEYLSSYVLALIWHSL